MSSFTASIKNILRLSSLLATAILAEQNVPPTVVSTAAHGPTTDPAFNPTLLRDNGGGGLVNGYHVILFGDTYTYDAFGRHTTALHNSVAYMGYRDPKNPALLYDFGDMSRPEGQRTIPSDVLTYATDNETFQGVDGFAIWPNSNIVPVGNGTQGLGIFPVVNWLSCATDHAITYYNTMVLIDAVDPAATGSPTVTADRVVPRLFYPAEIMYGTFAVHKGIDGFLYMYASSAGGLKVARTEEVHMTDRNHYQYWNGTGWDDTMPEDKDKSANIFTFTDGVYIPASGDIFYSPYFRTTMCVFQPAGLWSLYITYAIDNDMTGSMQGWSKPVPFHTFSVDPNCAGNQAKYPYAGHVYPDYDPTGETLLISWTDCNRVSMMTITWK